ncbi:MAG: GNAT family N-acetyltransferase [Bacteroidetes bacterium]|nr:MAG: GNAT family N-acetyltransferase [Bacteroidota bacterium]REK34201.1 MAG: GNAT family N-acetyltransferase [Bacteroidota bacterium]REK50531.1 MAG: GNAT family N-acetyltransferase [Bacteroidota bacterium]
MFPEQFQYQNYTIEVHDSLLSESLRNEWDFFTGERSNLHSRWLQIIENATPQDLKFRYFLIRTDSEKGAVAGVIYFQLLSFSQRNFKFKKFNPFYSAISLLLKLRNFKVLLAGNLFSVDFSPLKYDSQKLSQHELLNIVDSWVIKQKHDIFVMKDLNNEFTPALMIQREFDFFDSDLTMQMDILPIWKEFRDYEKSLKHKYSQRARKIRRAGEVLARKKISPEDFKANSEEFIRLFMNVAEHQVVRMGIVGKEYYHEIFDKLGDAFEMIAYYYQNKLIAFASYITYEKKLEVHYIGMDYQFNKEYYLYFNILFDSIEKAISAGKKHLELGRTAREAKAVIGCKAIYFNDYIRVNNKLSKFILKLLKKYFNKDAGSDWRNRHPYKS